MSHPASPPLRRALRRLAWTTPVVLAVLAGVHYLAPGMTADAADTNPATVGVQLGDIELSVTAVGSLKPRDHVDVGVQVSGQLQKVHVGIGDGVRKGQLIAEIEPTRLQATVNNDRARLEILQAQLGRQSAELELAERQLERQRRMLRSNAVSQEVLDQAESVVKVAAAQILATRAEIKAAQATLEGNLANLSYARIYAPMDGTVVMQSTFEGQTVNASQSAPLIVQVANLDVMTVWAQVAEADVMKLQPGMPAWFTTLGAPDARWRGTVRQVQPMPETANDVVLYNVLIDVTNTDRKLLPMMTVQVFFVLGEARGVPLVPLRALQAAAAGGRDDYQATVLTEQGPRARSVKLGLRNRAQAQVLAGLEVGDQLVLPRPAEAGGEARGSGGPRRVMGARL